MAKTVLFGRYRLIEPAGTGGSAQVWRARDKKTGDEVAVKRLHPIVFADEAGRARLKREFAALRTLDEPHIVHVRDLKIGEDDAALILDYVAGQSLADRLASGPPFQPADAVSVATDIAAALSAAHAAGIVHRDVTPGNILLDPNDGARLTDFGIALGGDGVSAVTATGQLMGTLRYLAPEQLRGEPATPATDIHSLGAVTYEMLSGRPPYEALTPVALAEAQAAGAEPLMALDPGLDNAVRRALSPDPADRPADAAAFAAELTDALANEPTEQIVGLPVAAGASAVPDPEQVAARPEPERAPARPAPTPTRTRNERGLAAPIAAVLALIFTGLVLAALAPTEPAGRSVPGAPTASVAATPTPKPSATPPPAKPKEDKGKGHGHGHGGD
jgi:serine/threonine protein kinase